MRWYFLIFIVFGSCLGPIELSRQDKLAEDIRYGWDSPFAVLPLDNDTIFNPATMQVAQPALSALKEFKDGVLIYFPDNEFDTSTLSFRYFVRSPTQTLSSSIHLKFSQNWPCDRGARAYYDTTFKNASFKHIDVESNDSFCGKKGQGISLVAKPNFGEVKFENGKLFYRPKIGYIGSDTFVYQTAVPKDFAPVFIRVFQDSGCIIVANTDYFSLVYRGKTPLDVLANDKVSCPEDFDFNRFSIVQQLSTGALLIENGKLYLEMKSYAPQRYKAIYEICYRNGDCSFAQLTLDLFPCPPIKAIADTYFMFGEWKTLAINYLENDEFCIYNLMQERVAIVESPKHGEVDIQGETFVYSLFNSSFLGTDSFVYKICDGQFNCDTARVFVSVRSR